MPPPKKIYSNPPRKPKTFLTGTSIRGGGSKGSTHSKIFGNITIPLSEEMSIMFGAGKNKQKIERDTARYHMEQNIKNQYRELGFNIENINFNYKQQSTKGNVNVVGNRGETYLDRNSRLNMQQAIQLNINDMKLNKSGTLTGNVSLTSGTRGLNSPGIPRDPMYPNREDFDPRSLKHENKFFAGIKYNFN